MSAVLQEIERTGRTVLPDGRHAPVHSGVDSRSGDVLRRAVEKARPRLGCEVGLAYGISSLHILEAMKDHGDGELIGMDPAQHDATWQGGGLHNIERAGFGARYRLHEESSQSLLPRLAAQGTRIQFAFIDGWHTFDHTLVDFFYLDRMMDVGGVMVLDDVGYPGLQRLAHFIVTNRAYTFLEGAPRAVPTGWRQTAKALARKTLHRAVRDAFTPSAASRALQAPIDACQLVALQKRGNDERRFDHFVAF
ncbi:class I SAM-dependent methyltransferase [Caenimonas aquaedulcis]|uniref:Class I SAM-dependent methyltransferase n=1 Tax=Caenimonas aquaedulcis TaxID=2793270 RepID=A0A931H5M6_9BURK|nr:class I SAM-dependent methyltransferase [Caenimonas aquaedulcis]MBG9389069.1 class I SAM-dependent methyltransferase [Caenimonas aquaedulcis]